MAEKKYTTPKLPKVETQDIPVVYEEAQASPMPPVGNPENIVTIGGKQIEIKPTKVRYQRDRSAMFYKALDLYPLADILSTDAGVFDEVRSGDKCVMDWLIAVTDDPKLIVDNYNDMDTSVIENLLVIFKRLNHIDEKEQKAKNVAKEREGAKKG